RDDELASLLEVPPLDDATRRRLVSHAVEEARPAAASRRPARALLAVAPPVVAGPRPGGWAFALVRVGGAAAPAAGPRARRRASPPATAVPGARRPPAGSGVGGASAKGRGAAPRGGGAGGGRHRPPAAPGGAAPACLAGAAAGDPTPSAYGTGTYRGRPVLVLLLPANGDHSTVELLATRTCLTVSVGDLS